ncbi:MAG: hypothetical protein P4L67_04280 [Candidatus Pacebacteria bacterium]|nr:hypothetical protein [Candidatus Paceibacterota bacterium]
MVDAKEIVAGLRNIVSDYNCGDKVITTDKARVIRDAAFEVERLTLRWSSEPPKVMGTFWVRFSNPEFRSIRGPWTMTADSEYLALAIDDEIPSNCEFAGPIAAPLEPDAAALREAEGLKEGERG